jgi:hypothetical protein
VSAAAHDHEGECNEASEPTTSSTTVPDDADDQGEDGGAGEHHGTPVTGPTQPSGHGHGHGGGGD